MNVRPSYLSLRGFDGAPYHQKHHAEGGVHQRLGADEYRFEDEVRNLNEMRKQIQL